MELQCKLGPRSATVALQQDLSVDALRVAIRSAFELGEDAELKILAKGKAIATDVQVGALASGSKLMVMASKAAERAAVDEAPRERMRGFEEDDLRQRTGAVGKAASGAGAVFKTRSAEPTYRFHRLQPLAVLPAGVTPGVPAAQQRLKELAEDPAILAIMKRHKFQVGQLSEMPPEGQVGVSAECLMGLNKNAGQEILLRLRTDDGQGLRPYQSVIPVLLHELTHNVWGDHDNNFKTLCSELTKEYKELQEPGYPATRSDASAASGSGQGSAGHVLGGGGAASMVEARAKAFGFYKPVAASGSAAAAPTAAEASEAMDVTDAQASGSGGNEIGGNCACGKCSGTFDEQCGRCEVNEG